MEISKGAMDNLLQIWESGYRLSVLQYLQPLSDDYSTVKVIYFGLIKIGIFC